MSAERVEVRAPWAWTRAKSLRMATSEAPSGASAAAHSASSIAAEVHFAASLVRRNACEPAPTSAGIDFTSAWRHIPEVAR